MIKDIDRDTYLAQCKKRALEFLDRGDVVNAVTSIGHDLIQHPEFEGIANQLMAVGMFYALEGDMDGVRRFIVGFR